MANTWETYLSMHVKNKQNPDGTYLQNTTEHCFIADLQGNILASTPGFQLGKYLYDMKIDATNTKKVEVDEKKILIELVNTGKPNEEVGVRLNNVKYMVSMYDKDKNLFYLSKQKGGACIMKTAQTIIFASYMSEMKLSNNTFQSPGMCNERVEFLAQLLIAAKY